MQQILKTHKFLSLSSNGISALLGLFTYSLLARSLDKEGFGIWVFFITVFTLFDMLRSGLLSNAVIKKVAEAETKKRYKEIVGSGWRLNLQITTLGSIVFSLILLIIFFITGEERYSLLTKWFALMALISMPHSMAVWVLNARMKFGKILLIRVLLQGAFFAGVLVLFFNQPRLEYIILVYFASNLLSALLSMMAGWSGLRYLPSATKKGTKSLFDFGKYSMGTLIGSNLLKSSDTFIILSFLGPQAVAIYNVPEKLLGLIEIPLRALISIAFPQLIKKYKEKNPEGFITEFEIGAGFSTILLLPVSILAFVFAEPLVVALGGQEYADSANILRVFAIYTALTPIDRFSGIALDVIDRPYRNMQKVFIMLTANVVGDLIVLYFWGEVIWVALVSTFTFSVGIIAGFWFLSDTIPFRLHLIFGKGYLEIVRLVNKYLK